MFSVVCPTMWRGKEFRDVCPKLLSCQEIGEIVVVNNEPSKTPSWFQNHPKIRVLDFGKNIYVNPAWNVGVKESKYDQICLLSDDVNFHPCLFQQMTKLNNKVGVLGMHFGNLHSNWLPLVPKAIRFESTEVLPKQLVFGCLMFVHKENYKDIPEELKIYYGVEYLCAHNLQNRKRTNYYIRNMDLQTNWGTTSHSSQFNDLAWNEHRIREDVFKREFPESYRNETPHTEEQLKEVMRREGTLLQKRVNAVTNSVPIW